MRSPGRSGRPALSRTSPPVSTTTPTFSCPQTIGYSIRRSCGVPAYCTVSPRKVCLSVPQIPEYKTCIRTAPGSTSGRGNSSTSITPGPFMTAARTLVTERGAGGRIRSADGARRPGPIRSSSPRSRELRAEDLVERVDVSLGVPGRALQHHRQGRLRLVVEERVGPLFVTRVHEDLVRLLVEQRTSVGEKVLRNPRSLLHVVDECLEFVLVVRALQHHLRVHPPPQAFFRDRQLDPRALRVAHAGVGANVLDREPGRLVGQRADHLGVLRYELEDIRLERLQVLLCAGDLRLGHVVGLLRPGRLA